MLKKIIPFLFVFMIFSFLLLFIPPRSVLAQCDIWDCINVTDPNHPWGTTQLCGCPAVVGLVGICGPGKYVCNSTGGCCPIGVVTPDNGSGGGGTAGGGSCTETAPTNLSSTKTSATSAVLNWTPGTGGAYQALWVSTNPDPQTGCAGSGGGTSTCPLRLDSATTPLPTTTSSQILDNILTPGTVYYWEVMNLQDSGCYLTATAAHLSSCSLSSSAYTLEVGNSRSVTSSITSATNIQNVTFSSNPTYVSVGTASDTTYPYQTLISGVSQTGGSTVDLSSNVYFTGGALACTSTSTVVVTPPQPWWQVKDSDVSSNGDLTTNIPDGQIFDLDGLGGAPGIPAASGWTDLNGINVSGTGWIVDSLQTNTKVYDHAFFNNQIPKDTVITAIPSNTIDGSILESGGTLSYGYYWYRYDGSASGLDLTISAPVNIGARKVILLVDSADLYINGSINLTDGQGFFMASVGESGAGTKGNIYIDPAVGGGLYDLEGIYQADAIFNTGASTIPLSVRGAVTGYDGVTMVRDLGDALNGTTPAEFFEYAPDQMMLYPTRLGSRKINWKEVAP